MKSPPYDRKKALCSGSPGQFFFQKVNFLGDRAIFQVYSRNSGIEKGLRPFSIPEFREYTLASLRSAYYISSLKAKKAKHLFIAYENCLLYVLTVCALFSERIDNK